MVMHDFLRYTRKPELPFHFFGYCTIKKAPGRIPPEALTTLINYIEIFSNVYNRFGLLIINISALCFQLYAFSPQ